MSMLKSSYWQSDGNPHCVYLRAWQRVGIKTVAAAFKLPDEITQTMILLATKRICIGQGFATESYLNIPRNY